jgi:hypothetical protein
MGACFSNQSAVKEPQNSNGSGDQHRNNTTSYTTRFGNPASYETNAAPMPGARVVGEGNFTPGGSNNMFGKIMMAKMMQMQEEQLAKQQELMQSNPKYKSYMETQIGNQTEMMQAMSRGDTAKVKELKSKMHALFATNPEILKLQQEMLPVHLFNSVKQHPKARKNTKGSSSNASAARGSENEQREREEEERRQRERNQNYASVYTTTQDTSVNNGGGNNTQGGGGADTLFSGGGNGGGWFGGGGGDCVGGFSSGDGVGGFSSGGGGGFKRRWGL